MRLRRQYSPLLWLLLPAFATSLTTPKKAAGDDSPLAIAQERSPANKAAAAVLDTIASPIAKSAAVTAKPEKGTKDAPVDGLDGKPHAGPWVALDGDSKKKLPAGVEDAVKKPVPSSVERLEKEGYASSQGWRLAIPEKNDGVMDDANRATPKEGTTGTEGGVSAKSKEEKAKELKTGEKVGKKPDPPKEPRPLPHSEQERMKGSTDGKVISKEKDETDAIKSEVKGAQGLAKPKDLPEKLADKSKSSQKAFESEKGEPDPTPLTDTPLLQDGAQKLSGVIEEPEGLIQPLHSFLLAFVMILFSEIGDKTFLVAALMAMRHDRMVVFSAAFSALIAMTVLSAVLGHAVPSLLPKRFVAFAAAILFLVFGAKLLREGLNMPKDSGVGEEMKEVEAELEEKEELARKTGRRVSEVTPYSLEAGRGRRSGGALPKPARSPSSDSSRSPSPSSRGQSLSSILGGLNNLLSLILSPAWVQTFIMTFLGEWGDRSQIATIAMAAGQDYWWVTGGAITGHAICTGVAVVGGRALAGKVSMRVVTIGGAVAFLAFGLIYLLECTYSEVSPIPH